jgi:hypothetical protein
MDHSLAERLTGLLYGNILRRNADEAGFCHYALILAAGEVRLKDVVFEFFTSAEFIETFVVNQTPSELTANLLACLFSPLMVTASDLTARRIDIVQYGLGATLRSMMDDRRYDDCHGPYGVPAYVENAIAAQLKDVA